MSVSDRPKGGFTGDREARRAHFVERWGFDPTTPEFREEMARGARLIAEADAKDPDLERFMEAVWNETIEDIERAEEKARKAGRESQSKS